MKLCRACGCTKPLDEFHRDSNKRDGHAIACKECAKARARQWAADHPERVKANRKELYAKNREKALADAKHWKVENRARTNEWHRNWNAANTDRVREKVLKWQRANPARVQAIGARRRAAKLRAMPKWIDHDKVKRIYQTAWIMNLSVDHIVPLISPKVCGLHVEHNLQLLPMAENQRKSNRYWPDMPE